jgi:hypothetical protein
MCRRDTTDPVLRLMLDRYRLHLLSVPRADAAVGDVYVRDGHAVVSPGNVRHLVAPPLEVVADRGPERMADISGEATTMFSASAGLGFLEGALAAMGAAGVVQQLRGELERERVRSVRFSFTDVFRSWTDVLEIGQRIWRHRVDPRQTLAGPGRRYFLVTATASTDTIEIAGEREDGIAPKVDVESLVGSVGGKVSAQRTSGGSVQFFGEEPLVFGVELHELLYDEEARTLRLKVASRPMALRGESAEAQPGPVVEPAVLGAPEDDLLLAVG